MRGTMVCEVKLHGTDLALRAGERVTMEPAHDVLNGYFVRPVKDVWPTGQDVVYVRAEQVLTDEFVAEDIYSTWFHGDTSREGDWFMVKLDDTIRNVFGMRANFESE